MRDRSLGATIGILFTTHTLSTGVVVAPSAALAVADFRIYKNGSATEKTSANGITVTSPFDSLVGSHLIEIDTGNATGDAGFWASGSAYRVVIVTAKTVDSKDPSNVCIGEFSLELQTADVRKFGGTAGTFAAGIPDAKVASIAANAITAASIAASALAISKFAADVGTTAYASNPIAQAIWERLTAALTTAGSAGKLLVDNLNATMSSRSTYGGGDTSGTTTLLVNVAALKVVTDKLDTGLVVDGAVWQWTVNALEFAPLGVGVGAIEEAF